jgi:hypothetical protein
MIKAMADAAKGLPGIPAHVRLRDEDLPFWEGILRARARDEWIEVDLVVAAQLARCQRDIEVESLRLEGESATLKNKGGRWYMNPRLSALEGLARREMALMRSLRMSGRAVGDPQEEAGRRSMQRIAEKVRKELGQEEEELLAS